MTGPPASASTTFQRFAGACAVAGGAGGLLYTAAFLIALRNAPKYATTAQSIFLLVGGLLSTAVLVALYQRLRATDEGFALWGTLLGVVAAIGTAVHGAFDLAVAANPPARGRGGFPSAVDPRGFLTFAVAAVALVVISWLMLRGATFPSGLARLGLANAALLVVVYVGRLTILNPKNPVLLGAALLSGVIATPLWSIWVGRELRRAPAMAT